jgi:YVTN family beta-propeller protein
MKKIVIVIFVTSCLFSCKKENEDVSSTESVSNPETGYLHGKFLVNEGNFGSSNASLSYVNNAGEIINDVYLQENGFELGDLLQSFEVIGERGYAVLNNSEKLVIIDLKSMHFQDEITGIDYPRYLINVGNGKAYLSSGAMAGQVYVIDLNTNSITGSIPVGQGPEKMIKLGNYVYVCNSGGWSLDNTVSVIDIATSSVVATIIVGDRPMDVVADMQGYVWVMCSGNDSWMTGGETLASLHRISSTTNDVVTSEVIGEAGEHPKFIAASASGDKVYFEDAGIRVIDLTVEEPVDAIFLNETIGSLDIDFTNGDIWISSVSDFVNPSSVRCYSSNGSLKSTFEAGIGTNAVVFN